MKLKTKIVPALRTFTDQTGVPIVAVTESAQGITLSQSRYRPLGVAEGSAQTWMIPLCLERSGTRSCTVLEKSSASIAPLPGAAALMANAGGAGYYRFRLDPAAWDKLIAGSPALPPREALAMADSLWADFAAGAGSFERVAVTAAPVEIPVEPLDGVTDVTTGRLGGARLKITSTK